MANLFVNSGVYLLLLFEKLSMRCYEIYTDDASDHRSYGHYLSCSDNSGLLGSRTRELCDTGEELHQLSLIHSSNMVSLYSHSFKPTLLVYSSLYCYALQKITTRKNKTTCQLFNNEDTEQINKNGNEDRTDRCSI